MIRGRRFRCLSVFFPQTPPPVLAARRGLFVAAEMSEEQRAELIRLHRAGMKYDQIAAELGIAPDTVKHRVDHLRAAGVLERRGHTNGVQATWDVASLPALWAEGHGCTEIARRLGVSKNAIVGMRRRLGLPGRKSPIIRGDADHPPRVAARPLPSPVPTLPALASEGLVAWINASVRNVPPEPASAPAAAKATAEGAFVIRAPAPAPRSTPAYGWQHECQWPEGDGRPWRFCCAPAEVGKPYCSIHDKRAHQNVPLHRPGAP